MKLSPVRYYVRLSLPKGVQQALRLQGASMWILTWGRNGGHSRLAALPTLIQRACCVQVVRGSRTCEGILPTNCGASAAAAPVAHAAAPPPALPEEPPACGAVVLRPALGVPSSAAVSPFHTSAAEVIDTDGETSDTQPSPAYGCREACLGCVPQTISWSGRK